jgi:hypothetical protein
MKEYINYIDKISNSYADEYTENDIINNLIDKIDDIYKTIYLDNNRDEYLNDDAINIGFYKAIIKIIKKNDI